MPRKPLRNLLGAIPAVVFCGLVAAFFATLYKTDPFSVGDAIAATIIFVVAFNSFFVISLILFYVWWFKRSKVALILSVVAFALNALGWLVGSLFCVGEF